MLIRRSRRSGGAWRQKRCWTRSNRARARRGRIEAPMLLYCSSGDLLWAGGLGDTAKVAEDRARHAALEAAAGLPLAPAFGFAAPDLVRGGLGGVQARDDHAMAGDVGPPVPAAV